MNALVKPVTWLLGLVLLLVGLVGFVMNPIFIFNVNLLHNIVHLVSGALGIAAASMGLKASRMFLIVFGLVYAVAAAAGFMDFTLVVDLLALNAADNFLHLAIAAVCLVLGFGSRE